MFILRCFVISLSASIFLIKGIADYTNNDFLKIIILIISSIIVTNLLIKRINKDDEEIHSFLDKIPFSEAKYIRAVLVDSLLIFILIVSILYYFEKINNSSSSMFLLMILIGIVTAISFIIHLPDYKKVSNNSR